MKLTHVINGNGTHQIAATFHDNTGKIGESVGYRQIAELKLGACQYIAVTEYYAGSALKPETVYQITEVK